jgi:hypothetical protein
MILSYLLGTRKRNVSQAQAMIFILLFHSNGSSCICFIHINDEANVEHQNNYLQHTLPANNLKVLLARYEKLQSSHSSPVVHPVDCK